MPDFDLDRALMGNYPDPVHSLERKRWTRKNFGWETRDAQKLENNTYLTRRPHNDGGFIYTVRLHSTDVLEQWPDGSVAVTSGGWRTVTTKARINEYLRRLLPHATERVPQVYQKNREWFWWGGWEPADVQGGRPRPIILGGFDDGDWFSADGTLHKDQRPVRESVESSFDVESAACNYIEQEVGRYDWKSNWENHRQQPGVEAKIQAWLDHYEYGGTAAEVMEFIDSTMMKAEGKWR